MKPSDDPAYVKAYLRKRRASLERSLGQICAACGDQGGPFHFDHIDPSSKRRPSHRESYNGRLGEYWRLYRLNQLQLLCEGCNLSKGQRCVDHRAKGFMAQGLERLREMGDRWLEKHREVGEQVAMVGDPF